MTAKREIVHRLRFPLMIATFIVMNTSCLGELTKISNCTCAADVVVYKCKVTGTGFTIWRGSAFECAQSGSEILLRHSAFRSRSGIMGHCNDGAIIGHSLDSHNLTFISELTVNLTSNPQLIGRTVECVHRNDNSIDIPIGTATIQLTDQLPFPSDIHLVSASPQQLTFNWTLVQSNCSTLQYSTVSDCGTCANSNDSHTTQTSMMCAIAQPTTDERLCNFSVQSIVCGNIAGVLSTPVEVTLKLPQSPSIFNFTPKYNKDSKLIALDISFCEVDSFTISEGIVGAALNYTVSYTDTTTNTICDTLTIPASSCVQGICTVPTLDPIPCSKKSDTEGKIIDIAISAKNILGSGPSTIFSIDAVNYFVNITFESATRVVCIFTGLINTQRIRQLSCSITYGVCQQSSRQTIHGTSASINTVVIDLPASIQSGVHCYTVNASNGSSIVLVVGSTGTIVNDSKSHAIIVTISIILVMVAIVLTVIIIALVLYCVYNRCRSTRRGLESLDTVQLLEQYPNRAQIYAHIVFDVEDQPHKLVKALEDLQGINIQNITIGPHETHSTRKIYIECAKDLTKAEKTNIKKSRIGKSGNLAVTCKAKQQDNIINEDPDVNASLKDSIKHEPGTLFSLLKFIYSIEDWQHINITDIIIDKTQTDEDYGQVVIKFRSDVTEAWREEYNQKKSTCPFIQKN